MLAFCKGIGLIVVPWRKADAVILVFRLAKGKAEEVGALAWCQSMLLSLPKGLKHKG